MALSPRLTGILDALPLREGMRVLELGCGTGALARGIADRVGPGGYVLGVDRSASAILRAAVASAELVRSGRIGFRTSPIEDLALGLEEPRFDLAVAIRVGAFDGRHPRAGALAAPRVRAALVPGGRLLVDGGDTLRVVPLD